MSKKVLILIIILAVTGIIGVGWQIISGNIVKEANQVVISFVDLSNIEDGSYTGEYTLSPVKAVENALSQ
ncbi:hypothetical protein C3E90_02895 [Clostridium sp. Cult2]|nr:hypothetical protein [Clostridium sp. Cult2]